MKRISHKPNFTGVFSDKRLDNRADKIASLLINSRNSSIKGITDYESEQKGFYRFLENERVSETQLIKELTDRCSLNVSDRDVLVIEDTSSIGLSNHRNRLKAESGIGVVGNKEGLGFLLHGSLVIDANNETMLGFSDVQLWHRQEIKSNNTTRIYKKQPITEKESYKWIKASRNSQEVLQAAKSITIIEDREGDIYDQFCLIPNFKTHLVIRSRENRKLADGSFLHDSLLKVKSAGSYALPIIADIRKNKTGRIAKIEIKFKKVVIQKPAKASCELPKEKELYAVEAREVNGPQKDAIKWRILTTHPITTLEEAIKIINMYKQRWWIEQLFRLMKKQGFRIEESELTTGWGIRKLTILLLNNVLRIMQLLMAYDNEDSQSIDVVFNIEEKECLKLLSKKYEQKKTKVKNDNSTKKLSWAAWIIARLGGWKGNEKQRPPGPITMKKGIEKFDLIFKGWKLAKQIA